MKISWDLNTNEEHTHNIRNHHRRHAGRGERHLHALRPVSIQSEVHQDDANATEDEHEAGGEALDDVLAVDTAGKEDDGTDGTGVAVLGWADAGRLDDDVIDDSGDHHEVSEEEEGVDGHGGGEGERRQLQAEPRRVEEAEWEDLEDVEDWIHGCSNGGGVGC